MRLDAYLLTGK